MILKILYVTFCLLLLAASQQNDVPRLSEASIMLPFSSDVYSVINAYNGCFSWETRDTIIELLPQDSCGHTVHVHPRVSVGRGRQSTWIVATDKNTNEALRCEVFLDKIHRLEIHTTTKKLYRGAVEKLEVLGFDAQNNTFTTMEGLVFDWEITSNQGANAAQILQFQTFQEVGLTASSITLDIERQKKRTSSVLVEAFNLGEVLVTTRLDLSYQESKSAQVALIVRQLLEINPEVAYAIPKISFNFQLHSLIRSRFTKEPLSLPDSNYKWSSSKLSVATISQSGLAETHQIGQTDILVQYYQEDASTTIAKLNVVNPAFIFLEAVPLPDSDDDNFKDEYNLHNWYLVSGRRYLFRAYIHEKGGKRIQFLGDLVFSWVLPRNYFEVIKNEGKNGEICEVRIIKNENYPTTHIDVGFETLTLKQQINIVPRISLTPKTALLPYDPFTNHYFNIKAFGGSGRFNWQAVNASVITVNGTGTIYGGDTLGQTTVKAHDKSNINNYDATEVIVSRPKQAAFINGPYEASVDEVIEVGVTLLSDQRTRNILDPYDNCSALSFTWSISENDIVSFETSPELIPKTPTISLNGRPACAVRYLKALKEGTVTISAKYNDFEATAKVNVYKGLRVSQSYVVVTLGSSYTIGIAGGPSPHAGDPTLFEEKLVAQTDPSAVGIYSQRLSRSSGVWRLHTIVCKKHETQTIRAYVGNRQSEKNPNPVTLSVDFTFSCVPAHYLYIHPNVNPVKDNRCAESMSHLISNDVKASPNTLPNDFRLRNNRVLTWNLVVFDESGNKFNNFSSLNVHWNTNKPDLLRIAPESVSDISPLEEGQIGQDHVYKRSIDIANAEGRAVLEISFGDYKEKHLEIAEVPRHYSRGNSRPVKTPFVFTLYSKIKLSPPKKSTYLHPDNTARFQITSGSGYYTTEFNGTLARQVSDSSSTELVVQPITEGVVLVTVSDTCVPEDKAKAELIVSDAHKIKILSNDLVPIDKSTTMEIFVHDMFGNVFPLEEYKYFNFKVQVDNKAVLAVHEGQKAIEMIAEGLGVGKATVTVSMDKRNKRIISSEPLLMHVYQPLKLRPSRVDLMPGAKYQIQWEGGPVRSEISFYLDDNSHATISRESGLIVAKDLGRSKIIANAYSFNSAKTDVMVASNDTAELVVGCIDGIRISTATNQIVIGRTVELLATGSRGESPFMWGGLPIKFSWENTNAAVGHVLPFNTAPDATLEQESSFVVNFLAKEIGRTMVTVRITEAPPQCRLTGMMASISLNVIESLRLLTPTTILLAPNSHYQISTNYDSLRQIYYRPLCDKFGGILDVSSNGLITTTNQAGTTLIVISDSYYDSELTSDSVILKVIVKPVNHLSLAPLQSRIWLPVGSSQQYDILLSDELGNAFDSYDGINLGCNLNIANVISTSLSLTSNSSAISEDTNVLDKLQGGVRSTLKVSALGPGSVIFQIYTTTNTDKPLSLYVPVNVINSVIPSEATVHVGGAVSFTTPFGISELQLYKNPWSSSNPSVISVNEKNGEATAKSIGHANIYYNSSVSTFTSVSVAKIYRIQLESQKIYHESSRSGVETGQLVLEIPVKFFTKDNIEIKELPQVKNNINLKCHLLDNSLNLKVTPSLNDDHYACKILFSQELAGSVKDAHPAIHAIASDQSETYKVDAKAHVSFNPIFAIIQKHVKITDDKVWEPITIEWSRDSYSDSKSLPELIVEAPSYFEITKIEPGNRKFERVDTRSYNAVYYSIELKKSPNNDIMPFTNQIISFANPNTGQKADVLVSYHTRGYVEGKSENSLLNLFMAMFVIIVTVVCAFYYYPSLTPPKQPQSTPMRISNTTQTRSPPYNTGIFNPGLPNYQYGR